MGVLRQAANHGCRASWLRRRGRRSYSEFSTDPPIYCEYFPNLEGLFLFSAYKLHLITAAATVTPRTPNTASQGPAS